MIDRVLESLNISGRIILILSGKIVDISEELQEELENIRNKYKDIIFLKSYEKLEGAAKSCLKAKDIMKGGEELIVMYCDQIFNYNSEDFLNYARDNRYDGLISTYKNDEPKDDFLICDEQKNLIQLVPKKVVSDIATVGMYYWRDNKLFFEGMKSMISKNIKFNNEYYVGPIFNENVTKGYKVSYFDINVHQVGNPEDYEKYIQYLNKK
ncbi:hypothetical protein EOM39_06220 [Candidatus Gracilibacteria bacterium]|nr:hypothetical protein [Candidatus Gracilibacteria bacterium]